MLSNDEEILRSIINIRIPQWDKDGVALYKEKIDVLASIDDKRHMENNMVKTTKKQNRLKF